MNFTNPGWEKELISSNVHLLTIPGISVLNSNSVKRKVPSAVEPVTVGIMPVPYDVTESKRSKTDPEIDKVISYFLRSCCTL